MTDKIQFKKGKYYIGDPCYVFEKSWSDVLHKTDYFRENKLFGKTICGGGTVHGDGIYQDGEARDYGVDAGLIAILPISLLKIDNKETVESVNKSDLMHIIHFKEDFEAWCENGKFQFGHIEIDTDPEDEEDECPHCGHAIH